MMKNKIGVGIILAVVVGTMVAQAGVIYSNDFSGALGANVLDSAVIKPGLDQNAFRLELNGSGQMTQDADLAINSSTSMRVQLAPTDLATDPLVTAVKMTAVLRTSINANWIAMGFGSQDVGGFLVDGSGPWLQLNANGSMNIRGGESLTGSGFLTETGLWTAGDVVKFDLIYYTQTQTVDVLLNDVAYTTGMAITHFELGTEGAPVINYAQINLRLQESTSAYADSFVVETIPEPATLGMIGFAGLAILFIRRTLLL